MASLANAASRPPLVAGLHGNVDTAGSAPFDVPAFDLTDNFTLSSGSGRTLHGNVAKSISPAANVAAIAAQQDGSVVRRVADSSDKRGRAAACSPSESLRPSGRRSSSIKKKKDAQLSAQLALVAVLNNNMSAAFDIADKDMPSADAPAEVMDEPADGRGKRTPSLTNNN